MPKSAEQQDRPRLNLNNMSYTHQNLMGLKRLENRQITLQHIQNSVLNELNRNYGLIYNTERNLGHKAG